MNFLKFLLVILVILSKNSFAKSDKFLIGIDGFHANFNHQFSIHSKVKSPHSPLNDTVNDNKLGGSLSLGYIFYNKRFSIAPEVFYDYINISSKDFFYHENDRKTGEKNAYINDRINIKDRYGARLNFGYRVYGNLNLFLNAGIANVNSEYIWKNYDIQGDDVKGDTNYKESKISGIYGAGFTIDITNNLIFKSGYDFQQLDNTYVIDGLTNTIKIHTIRIGTIFAF